MNAHVRLTESSRTRSLIAPIGKGREGKGRDVGHPSIVSTGSALANLAALPFPAMDGMTIGGGL